MEEFKNMVVEIGLAFWIAILLLMVLTFLDSVSRKKGRS